MIILNSHRNVFLNTFFFFKPYECESIIDKTSKKLFLKNSNIQTNNKQIKGNL